MTKPARIAALALLLTLAACWTGEDVQPRITNHVEDWRDEVIYQLLTDRFADGDLGNNYNVDRAAPGRYHGGDFAGIREKIPYLKELGVTTVWISPIVKNVEEDSGHASYHGYWAQDFSSVNPHFGDVAQMREMVNALHEADIKVILDIVTNHVGQLFYYDINGNGHPDESVWGKDGSNITHISEWDPDFDPRGIMGWTSLGESGPAPIRWLNMPSINRLPPLPVEFQNTSWYNRRGRVTNWEREDMVERGDFPGGLKDLNTQLPEVREALFKVYAAWIDSGNFDGFRVDTVKHVEHEAWQHFCGRIREHAKKAGKKNFFLFGEVFDGRSEKVGSYTVPGEFDTLFNFPQKFAIDQVFKFNGPTKILEENYKAKLRDFSDVPSPGIGINSRQAVVNFLDNHDVPRFLFDKPSVPALQTALAYLFFEEGIPDVYYGTEQEFDGGNDPRNREDLSKSGYSRDTVAFRWIAKLSKLRKAYSALRRGSMEFRWTTAHTGEEQDAGIVAFERTTPDQTVLVVINTSDGHESETAHGGTTMRTSFEPGTALEDVISGEAFEVGNEGELRVSLKPRTTRLLVPASQVVKLK